MSKQILLFHVSDQPQRLVKAAIRENQPFQWVFLCQDYLEFLRWKKVLGDKFQLIKLNPDLQEVAQQMRQPFLNLITEFGRNYNSPAWWASRVSERNTMVSFIFLYCCYLNVFQKKISKLSGTLFVISESWVVLESLSNIAKGQGCRIKWVTRQIPGKRQLMLWIRIVVQTLRLIRKAVLGRMVDSDLLPTDKTRPGIILHTYVDESCFGDDGLFSDRYFPGLSKWLERNGCDVMTIPVLFNVKRSYRSTWRWFRNSHQKFINPFKYYRLSDYIFAIKESWKQVGMPKGQIILEGMDITYLFKAERENTAFSCLDTLLYFRLPKRLSEAGFRIDLVIAEYENMINEKLLTLGLRHYLPSVKIIGFQHGALYPFLLCNFVTSGESKFAPLPDHVVCNGEFFREILIREGLPAERAVVGPALRYTHLWQKDNSNSLNNIKSIDVLVIMPLMQSDAIELLTKIIHAFGNVQNLKVILKPHPMSSLEDLLKTVGIKNIPSHFQFVQGNMSEWIRKGKVVIGMSSCAIYEAFVSGVCVIVVGREASIELNPLGFFADLNRIFYSPEEILAESMRLLSLSSEELTRYRDHGKEILQASFNPVNDQTMRVFVEGLVDGFKSSSENLS